MFWRLVGQVCDRQGRQTYEPQLAMRRGISERTKLVGKEVGILLSTQEVHNHHPLATLKLDDRAGLLVEDEGTVAREFLSDRTKSVSGQTRE